MCKRTNECIFITEVLMEWKSVSNGVENIYFWISVHLYFNRNWLNTNFGNKGINLIFGRKQNLEMNISKLLNYYQATL